MTYPDAPADPALPHLVAGAAAPPTWALQLGEDLVQGLSGRPRRDFPFPFAGSAAGPAAAAALPAEPALAAVDQQNAPLRQPDRCRTDPPRPGERRARRGLGARRLGGARATGIDRFDAVLMDSRLPGLDGYEAVRAIRTLFDRQALPVIALSADGMLSDHRRACAAGMNDEVGKPVDATRLLDMLRRWFAPAP